jgi:hypothetical protein
LYVFELPEQMLVLPLIVPGTAGTLLTVTLRVLGTDEPQALLAVTLAFPLVALAMVLMEFVVEVPVQPPGKVHV